MLLQFNYFLKNSFGLLLMLFWLFSMAMTSFSYMLSVLVKKPQVCADTPKCNCQHLVLSACLYKGSTGELVA